MIDLRTLSFFFLLLKVSLVSCLFGGYHFMTHHPLSSSTLATRRTVLSACLTTTPLITVTNATATPNDPNLHDSSIITPIRNNFGKLLYLVLLVL